MGTPSGSMSDAAARTHATLGSPLGQLTVVARENVVVGLYFPDHWYLADHCSFGRPVEDGFDDARRELAEYFAGERREFDLPVAAAGDRLHRHVWDLIRQVPYGQTSTYGELARELDDGTTPQAVGAAVGRNPLSILIPCHRIVGSSGQLTGYAGGLHRKRFLLDLEKATTERPTRLF